MSSLGTVVLCFERNLSAVEVDFQMLVVPNPNQVQYLIWMLSHCFHSWNDCLPLHTRFSDGCSCCEAGPSQESSPMAPLDVILARCWKQGSLNKHKCMLNYRNATDYKKIRAFRFIFRTQQVRSESDHIPSRMKLQ